MSIERMIASGDPGQLVAAWRRLLREGRAVEAWGLEPNMIELLGRREAEAVVGRNLRGRELVVQVRPGIFEQTESRVLRGPLPITVSQRAFFVPGQTGARFEMTFERSGMDPALAGATVEGVGLEDLHRLFTLIDDSRYGWWSLGMLSITPVESILRHVAIRQIPGVRFTAWEMPFMPGLVDRDVIAFRLEAVEDGNPVGLLISEGTLGASPVGIAIDSISSMHLMMQDVIARLAREEHVDDLLQELPSQATDLVQLASWDPMDPAFGPGNIGLAVVDAVYDEQAVNTDLGRLLEEHLRSF